MAQVPNVGIAWYSRMSYQKLRSIFDDGGLLPASFEEWERIAERGSAKLAAAGYRPIHVYIELVTFTIWCREHHFRLDSEGRKAFADFVACEEQRNRYNG